MRRIIRIAYTIIILCAILFVMGCAKKTLGPVTPEVSKPQPPGQTGMPAEQPGMKMDTSEASQGAGAASGKSAD